MERIVLYKNCVRIKGNKTESYCRVDDKYTKPEFTSCDQCNFYTKCLSQYRQFNGEPKVEIELPEEPITYEEPKKKSAWIYKKPKDYWTYKINIKHKEE